VVPSSALSGIVILGKVPVLTFDVLSSTYTVTPFVASSNPPCPEFPQYIKRVISLVSLASEKVANAPHQVFIFIVNSTLAPGATKSSCAIFPFGVLGIEMFSRSSNAPDVLNETMFPTFPSFGNVGSSYPSRGF